MEISNNSFVKLHYKGTLSDGTVFDSSEGRDALEFISGIGLIIPGLDEGIQGLKVGDKKTISVPADKAYGPRHDEAMQEVPKDQFPPEINLEVGMQLAAQGPQGAIPVVVTEILDEVVKVDFNHPLAGKDLTFDVEVVDVREATEEDMAKFMPQPQEGGCCSGGTCSSHSDEKEASGECCGSGKCSTDKKE